MGIVLALFILLFPAVVVRFRGSAVVKGLSPIVVCYVIGIVIGNIGLVELDGPTGEMASTMQAVTVLLAIPLLLFGADLKAWVTLARPTMISFGLIVATIVVVAPITANLLAGDINAAPAELAGMTVGVYTGGTANMAAVQQALDVDSSVFVAMNAADVAVSSLYLLALMTVLPRLLAKFLPPFRRPADAAPAADIRTQPSAHAPSAVPTPHHDEFAGLPSPPQAAKAVAMAVAGVLLAVGVAFGAVAVFTDTEAILDSDAFGTAAILAITTVGVLGSLVPKVRNLDGTYEVGQYLFLAFAIAIGTVANLGELADSLTTVLPFIATALVVATLIHYGLCKVFGIDRDTAIITSTAAIFGPPFVGPIAGVLGNRDIVVSGMTTGVVGLAVGNYAGLAVAKLLA